MQSQISFSKPRIDMIDALRGTALLGILLIHSVEHWDFYSNPINDPQWLQGYNKATFETAFFLFGGKAYAIFAMMFGVSFSIILNSWSKQGINFRGRFIWRVSILAAFGYLHGLIYCGDILLTISLLAIPLVFLYKLSNRWLFIISILVLIQIPTIIQAFQVLFIEGFQPKQPLHWSIWGNLQPVFANGSFLDVVKTNAYHGQTMRLLWVYECGRYLQMFGLFIIGVLIGRFHLFEDINKGIRISRIILIAGIAGFILFYPIKTHLESWGLKDLRLYYVDNLVSAYCNLAQTAIWASGFYLLYQWHWLQKLFNLLIPYGRMSLSCYVTQALIGIPLFYGYGFALYKVLGSFYSIFVGIGIFIFQLVIARIWLKYYLYGPLEWVWRAFTFRTFTIPFRKP